jgi:hypothetical protein
MDGTSEPNKSPDPKVIERYRNKSFPGHGYMIEQQTDFEGCEKRCKDEDACVALTYTKKTRDCYLLDNISKYSSASDADSAVKRHPAK